MNIGGWDPTGRDFTKLSWVKAPAAAGDRLLKLGCCMSAFSVGQMVRLWMRDPGDGSLMSELHNGRAQVPDQFKGALGALGVGGWCLGVLFSEEGGGRAGVCMCMRACLCLVGGPWARGLVGGLARWIQPCRLEMAA